VDSFPSHFFRLKHMRDLAIVLFVVGVLLVLHSVYTEKMKELAAQPKVEYRYIPRDVYYDSFFNESNMGQFKHLFE
jgi:hypothetical protein